MQIYLEIILVLLVIIAAAPALLFCIEIFFALFPQKTNLTTFDGKPKVTILMPAHNEEAVIGDTIVSLQKQLSADHCLIVVADNCTDNTVKIARSLGAEVLVRNDDVKRGKGFALEFGVQHLKASPPDILIMMDADCTFADGSIELLVQKAAETNRPAQALYLFNPDDNSSTGQYLSVLAIIIKNHVRPLGLKNMGVPCQLTGSGMAFPWAVMENLALGSSNIVEDMKMGIDLVKAGHYLLFCPEARVNSTLPSSKSHQVIQRTRWEHGHLQMIISEGFSFLITSLKKRQWKAFLLALDLIIPPLSMVVFFMLAGLGLTGVCSVFFGVGSIAVLLMLGVFILFIMSLLLAWWRFGKHMVPAKIMIGIPGYILSKVSIYLAFIRNREKEWIRTERD